MSEALDLLFSIAELLDNRKKPATDTTGETVEDEESEATNPDNEAPSNEWPLEKRAFVSAMARPLFLERLKLNGWGSLDACADEAWEKALLLWEKRPWNQ